MGLLDMLNEGQKNENAPMAQANDSVESTEKKMSYGARQRLKQIEAAQRVKEHLEAQGIDLTPIQEDLDILLRTKKESAGTGHKTSGAAQKPVLYKMFGNAPKKGDRVTAADMFARTFKGFQEMRQLIKKWALKGIEVEYISADKEFVLNTDVEPWSGADTGTDNAD